MPAKADSGEHGENRSACTATTPTPNTHQQTLSACVITRDEELRLPRCLDSLSFCDEVVVVDSGSRDGTVQIAQAAGAVVVQNPWPGFAAQRNVAIDSACSDWILEVDADEWISPELAAEIRHFLQRPPADISIAVLPMRQRFMGATLGPSAHYPFYRPRMFRRGAYRHDEDRSVHEGLYARTRPWVFTADMHHELAATWREMLQDGWAYAKLEASQLQDVPMGAAMGGALLRPPAKFLYQLVLLGGWRDGWQGTLKVGLDSLVDVIVWIRCLLGTSSVLRLGMVQPDAIDGNGSQANTRGETSDDRRQTTQSPDSAVPEPVGQAAAGERVPRVHYGRRKDRVGPIRVALVCSASELRLPSVGSWLETSQRAGAWVSVITESDDAPPGARVYRVARLGALRLMRALDAERQLGPFDAVVAPGWLTRLLLRLMPSSLRSYGPVLDLEESTDHLRELAESYR
ncbi:MAG: glycosyltransferase family 2 protein [Solirubrobacteraceae bacterium]